MDNFNFRNVGPQPSCANCSNYSRPPETLAHHCMLSMNLKGVISAHSYICDKWDDLFKDSVSFETEYLGAFKKRNELPKDPKKNQVAMVVEDLGYLWICKEDNVWSKSEVRSAI